MLTITKHAIDKARERLGLKEQMFREYCNLAYTSGTKQDKAPNSLKGYLIRKSRK